MTELPRPPFWRDEKILKILVQAAFLALVIGTGIWAMSNYLKRGLSFSFGFLDDEASFDLAEGIPFAPTDPYARAFLVGVVNTIRVAGLGIVLASALGLLAGTARLSSNWLVRKIATVYVEIARNTPLLVQLFFIYFAVILQLPRVSDALVLPGPVFLSNRGVAMPWLRLGPGFAGWWPFLLGGLMAAIVVVVLRHRGAQRKGRPPIALMWAPAALVGLAVVGWFVVGTSPLVWDTPEMVTMSGGVLRVEQGARLSSEFTALLVGLVIYTGAYIAEVVRAGIQAVPRGQTEAARSQGFTRGQILRLIVLPQALRVIIPPLISQYLNLTKNSSLAIAIGFLDVYAVSQTMLNQSGRVVEVFLMIMAVYLTLSLTISLVMNMVNRRFQIVER